IEMQNMASSKLRTALRFKAVIF
ncbi:uncharacterized protein METZ01_LOCUS285075, partial [marine metagenome]